MEERNINFTEGEVCDLKRALKVLVDKEQDQRDYTAIFNKLDSWYL